MLCFCFSLGSTADPCCLWVSPSTSIQEVCDTLVLLSSEPHNSNSAPLAVALFPVLVHHQFTNIPPLPCMALAVHWGHLRLDHDLGLPRTPAQVWPFQDRLFSSDPEFSFPVTFDCFVIPYTPSTTYFTDLTSHGRLFAQSRSYSLPPNVSDWCLEVLRGWQM
uniref:Uncharacterized protein n=1 Tax=Pfiesteria piscicida TaxID=71001 RepID=A3E3T1_PFIPI|nr:unknown [Pfiesteria piscicida]